MNKDAGICAPAGIIEARPQSGISFPGKLCYKNHMASRLNRIGRYGGGLLACLAFAGLAGCASKGVRPLPPGGLPSEPDRRAAAGEKAAAQQTEAARPVPRESAAAPRARPAGVSGTAAEHVLQVGDEIDIQVYREPELSGTFKINPSGEIRHSLAGSIPMAGKTIEEAEAFFTRKLARDYLVDPRVIVKLLSTQSSQIVLMGEVKNPGVYPLPFGETMTLLQAIAGAGGFTELASPDRVRIVRRLPNGHQTTLKFRVSDLLGGKGKQQDVPLEPNDVVMVPEVLF